MMRPSRALLPCGRALAGGFALLLATVPAEAQRRVPRPAAPPAYDPTLFTDPAQQLPITAGLRWRLVGPFRGGRVTAVSADPKDPLTFWFGAVNGGVWKSTNAGQSWTNVTDGVTDLSSVGAISVAPSDPNVIWVGTGEGKPREDLTYGTGVYRSTDGGKTWVHRGLAATQQVAALRVDPRNPDVAFVAAIGHAFGPNRERGIFRTTDGGATWKHVLFVDDSTGAADVALDPTNPRIVFAAMWKFQRTPWGMDAGGGRSGLWRSTDGGDTWQELTFAPGMPKGPIGRIGVAVSPANPQVIYATIEAPDDRGGIFRSDDGGDTWRRTSGDQRFAVRPWYYSTVTADPQNPDVVYVMNLGVYRSIDGGKAWTRVRVPHGDTHVLWIDPANPRRMINGNDGGATVSLDGGATWSAQDNQPTSQFYHVITDRQFPYRLYGAQQDNSTVSIASRSDNGTIGVRDWWPVAGCENAHIAVDPRQPDVTYGGCYMGSLSRYDRRTGNETDISVELRNWDGYAAGDVPERFQWTFPVLLSPHDPTVLYATSQHVWRTRDEGKTWTRLSPDLTRADPKTLGRVGGPVTGEMTGAEWYATIYAFDESPKQRGVLWAGSDDGLVHVSRDDGATWTNVTPPDMAPFTRVTVIEPSPHDAATAYVAATRYQLDDFAPYFWKTTDYGRTWTRIVAGLPWGAYSRSIREDPVRRGLLYAGTEIGVYVSFDDGASWQTLQRNLPRVSVRDLRVHGNDLVAATHGRSFWILDDVTPLRQWTPAVAQGRAHFFAPAPAVRFAADGYAPRGAAGENPRSGVVLDWWLRAAVTTGVTLEIRDAAGAVVRTFRREADAAADAKDVGHPAADSARRAAVRGQGDSLAYPWADSIPPARAGANRFVWTLRANGPATVPDAIVDDGTTAGPRVPPGRYVARLMLGADTLERPFEVVPDPRLTVTQAEYEAQYRLALDVTARIAQVAAAEGRIRDLKAQLEDRAGKADGLALGAEVKRRAEAVSGQFEGVRAELYEVKTTADQATLNYPIKLYQMFITLNSQVQAGDREPTASHRRVFGDLDGKLARQLQALRALEAKELAELNALLEKAGLPPVYAKPAAPPTAM
jgi:photosystem II stability/assembly factor-like uncharacterized protein